MLRRSMVQFLIVPGALCLGVAPANVVADPASSDPIAQASYEAWHRIEPEGRNRLDRFAMSHKGNRLGWGASVAMDAHLLMYEGTGDPRYLQAIASNLDEIFNNRADRWGIEDGLRGRVVKAWSTNRYTTDRVPHVWLAHNAAIARPVLRWAYFVKQNPELHEAYLDRAREAVVLMEETLLEFEEDWRDGPGDDEGYYVGLHDPKYATHRGGIQDEPMPFNYQTNAGMAFLRLYQVTGEQRYLERTKRIARFFKNRLRVEGDDAYAWRYAVYRDDLYEDTSHATWNVQFAAECHRAGIVFDTTDMQRFANTIKRFHRGPDSFPHRIDGTGDTHRDFQMSRWAIYASHDPEVRELAYDFLRQRWDESPVLWRYMNGAAYLYLSAEPEANGAPLPVLDWNVHAEDDGEADDA